MTRRFLVRCCRATLSLAIAGTFVPARAQQGSAGMSMLSRDTAVNVARNGATPADDYLIGAGDVLSISVWKEPDVSVPTVVVRPDGKIALPLLKDIPVA